MITLADIVAARDRIAGGIYESPCVESIPLSQLTGARIYCKLDYLQRTGSFKERGARNALLQLSNEQRRRGVIAASAGNHAQGVAYPGGLLAGIGIVVDAMRPDIELVGVEPEGAACLAAALAAGEPVQVVLTPTLADGLAVPRAGVRPFEVLKRVVDTVVAVDEAAIALAILRLIELEKSVVEGGGATPLAALLAGKLDHLKGKNVVLVLAGGNIDLTMLDRVIDVGLVADGRLTRFTVSISDRPGGLARLAEVIASTGASIKEIIHDRAFSGPDLSAVRVLCVVETTGHDHVMALHRALDAAGVRRIG